MKKIFATILAAVSVTVLAGAQELSLQDCLDMAAENEVKSANAELDVLASRAQRSEAMSMWFPTVSVSGMYFYAFDPLLQLTIDDILGTSGTASAIKNFLQNSSYTQELPTQWNFFDKGYTASVVLKQPVFAGGRIVNGNRLAALGVEAAQVKRDLARKETSASVEQKYWNVVSLQEKMKTLDAAISMVESIRRDAVNAFNAGLVLDLDTLKAGRELNNLHLQKNKLSSGTRIAKMDLFNAIGYEYSCLKGGGEAPYVGDVTLSGDLAGLASPEQFHVDEVSAAALTEESRLLGMQVQAADLQKKIALGEAMPEVGVGAVYGYGDIFGDACWNGGVGVSVKIPLTDWWSKGSKAKRLGYEAEKARNEQEYLDSQIELKIRQQWENLMTMWQEITICEDNVAMDTLSQDRTQDLYQSGQATMSELLEAQTNLQKSRNALTDAQISYRLGLSDYLRTTGR
ncbi:MAG: TolC family protein [Candidatus Cryptobacteroides sp.]